MPLAAILALAPQFIEGGKSLYEFIHTLRQTAQQSGEWTEEHELEFVRCVEAASTQAHWVARNRAAQPKETK